MCDGAVRDRRYLWQLTKEEIDKAIDKMRWQDVTQVTFPDGVYVPFEEYKRDVERLRKRVSDLEEIHKKAVSMFGSVEYLDREYSWREHTTESAPRFGRD